MRSTILKQLEGKGIYKEIRNFSKYKRPSGNISWTINYNIPIQKKLENIEFLFICHIETPNGKVFIAPNLGLSDEKSPSNFNILTSHFLKQFKKRAGITSKTLEECLAIFFFDGDFALFNLWEKDSSEMRYLNKWGFSIGTYDLMADITHFETFVTKEQLFKDQKKWVTDFLNVSIPNNSTDTNNKIYEHWHKFLDDPEIWKNRITLGNNKVKGVYQNAIKGGVKELINQQFTHIYNRTNDNRNIS